MIVTTRQEGKRFFRCIHTVTRGAATVRGSDWMHAVTAGGSDGIRLAAVSGPFIPASHITPARRPRPLGPIERGQYLLAQEFIRNASAATRASGFSWSKRCPSAVVFHLLAIDPASQARHDLTMRFEILGEISDIETFATGSGIREIARLRRIYGRGR
jgi:hypothetical protein